MNRIYLDNAATTPLDAEVLQVMMPFLTHQFGNPSSIYSFGREARLAVEQARKAVASLLHSKPGELFFTSGGTESSNMAILCGLRDLSCTRIITSPIEHHATLHTVQALAKQFAVPVEYVHLLQDGHVDLEHFEQLLKNSSEKTFVSLMHGNNEIGNLTDIMSIGKICHAYQAIFHSDTVQTFAHYPINLQEVQVHFLSASAHKFHGPKGAGLLFIRSGIEAKPLLWGGSQERNMRAGTENVAGIAGFAAAFERATTHLHEDMTYIRSLKDYMKEKLISQFEYMKINGDHGVNSLYTVLNVGFPRNERTEMLSIQLDVAGICVSGGSACNSGAQGGSHVISNLYPNENIVPIRFSFSKHNTFEEIDHVIDKIKDFL
jgi:cysteine desulfurase